MSRVFKVPFSSYLRRVNREALSSSLMASNIIDVTRDMVREYMARLDPSHDMEHVERVVRTGKKHCKGVT